MSPRTGIVTNEPHSKSKNSCKSFASLPAGRREFDLCAIKPCMPQIPDQTPSNTAKICFIENVAPQITVSEAP